MLAASQPLRARHMFLLAAIPTRLAGAYLFSEDGKSGTAIWDGTNALANLLVVVLERMM